MPYSLDGTYIAGAGKASEYLKRQLPDIITDFPEVSVCKFGTINIKLGRLLFAVNSDFYTPKHGGIDLVRVEIESRPVVSPTPAWIYISHLSGLRSNPFIHELIAPPLPNIEIGMNFNIVIFRDVVEKNYWRADFAFIC